ncbi:MAG: peptidoglycan editing factor PgeF [Clostridiales bacterium]|nr:peptidoglycan editing factor PgeF [Clostridiales bacterium]
MKSLEKELLSDEAHIVYGPDNVPVIKFNCYEKLPWLSHGFSTREGGASSGAFESMNLSFTRGDAPEVVMENFKRFGNAVGMDCRNMVFTHQTHTTNVRAVTAADRGKGICTGRDFENIDGLVTDTPGAALVTFFADCVPLFFVDIKRRAIGASHSGWRGTVGKMGLKTVEAMKENYGCSPGDIVAVIGPSICKNCYEVSEDVARAFREALTMEEWRQCFIEKGGGKYMLDLWKANECILLGAGLCPENIHVSGLCTHCHQETLWSHRALGNSRGSLAGFIMLKPEE